MPVLKLDGACQTVNDRPFLGPVTLDLDLVGVTCVLGPNGAGKSLLLSLCHGMRPPDAGRVTWDGLAAADTRTRRAYMMQHPVVLRRTVAANVAYPLSRGGAGGVARALATARLSDKANSPAATLSGGELRRMALARALVTDPDVLILDEPFAGLDPANAAEIEAAIVAQQDRRPILMSTHDLVQARRMAARVLFMAEGQLVENAPAERFFRSPASAAARSFLKGHFL